MSYIFFNIHLYFTGITTYIYTELALKLTGTPSVAQSVEVCLEIQDFELHFSQLVPVGS